MKYTSSEPELFKRLTPSQYEAYRLKNLRETPLERTTTMMGRIDSITLGQGRKDSIARRVMKNSDITDLRGKFVAGKANLVKISLKLGQQRLAS